MNLLALPNELLFNIINRCDLQTLGRLCGVCRHLEESINNLEAIWKCMWEQLQYESGYNVPIDKTATSCYRSMCRRYVPIKRQMKADISKREPHLIGPLGYPDDPDVLSLDIGSKTTWLKRSRGSWSCFEHTRTPCHRLPTAPTYSRPSPRRSATCQQQQWQLQQQLEQRSSLVTLHLNDESRSCCASQFAGGDFPCGGDSSDSVSPTGYTDVEFCREEQQADPLENGNGWLDDVFLPRGPVLCTCVLCEPQVKVVICPGTLPGTLHLQRPTSCLHADPDLPEGNHNELTIHDACHSATERPGGLTQNEARGSGGDYPRDTALPEDCGGFRLGGGEVPTLVRRLAGLGVNYWRAVVQLCEPTGWPLSQLVNLVREVFETLGVSSLCLVPKPVCIALALGMHTCLVVDSGAHHTHVAVVVNRCLVLASSQVRTVGGAHVSECLAHVLEWEGVSPKVCACQLDGRDIKEKCHLSHHIGSHRTNAPQHLNIRSLRHPGGWCTVTLTEELSLAPEVMYLALNLPEMIQKALTPLPFDLQKRLVANIVLSGGNSRMKGLDSRLQLDLQVTLTRLAPWIWVRSRNCLTAHDAVEGVSYVSLPSVGRGASGPWSGGEGEGYDAILRQPYVTRTDYVRHGAEVCLDIMQSFWRANPADL